ncbi:MAG: M42 family metallopeptidase [Fimbriimonadaceae bacterium]|jgi:endoglucanase|nr:M42 family metallopeptidase [Fimbriimonadaceae bacterium]
MRDQSLDFLKSLVNTPSPSGYEERVAQVYREYTSSYAHQVNTDFHGNTWAVLNPDAEMKIMLAGHMDEIGFIIHYISDDGFLHFSPVGGHDPTIPLGQRVWVHGKERVAGVIGRKPIHLLEPGERDKKPELHEYWIDIGATKREEVEELIELGDPVTFQVEFQHLLGDRAVARGFDNRVGSFIVAEALRLLAEEGGLDGGVGVYAVATVQEEIGLRGARTSAFSIDPQSGIAVDVNFAIDHPGLSKARYGQLDIGKGPSVGRGANINPIVYRMIKEAAAQNEIPIQISPEPGGTGTDANAMQVSRSGMATGLLGVPLRYMHTPCELLSLTDVEQCAKLMAGYCRLVKPDTDFTPRVF